MNGGNYNNREITFSIVEHIGVLAAHSTGWKKELNLVSWNDAGPKYDIRDWSPDHEHMSRGVTLHEKEMKAVVELLRGRGRSRGDAASDIAENAAAEMSVGYQEGALQDAAAEGEELNVPF